MRSARSLSLDAGPWDVALRYAPAGPDHIRLYVPKNTPLPPILDRVRSKQWLATAEARGWGEHEPTALYVHGSAAEMALRR